MMRRPSGENATEFTNDEWPTSGLETAAPVSASEVHSVLFQEPEMMRRPLGENASISRSRQWAFFVFQNPLGSLEGCGVSLVN